MHSRAFPLFLLTLLASACSKDEASVASGPEGGAALDFGAFDTMVNDFIADHGLKGASAVIVHKDRGMVHLAGYGEYAEDRNYLVMSSSKIMSVGIMMRLADQGVLNVDGPIGNYVGSWDQAGKTSKPELTVAQLVSGSSGLVGIIDNLLYAPYACMSDAASALSVCASALYTADDAAERKQPDTEFHYGGAAWQLAGGVAEAASGKSWAELFQETYGPCEVPSIGYTNATALVSVTFQPDGGLSFGGIGYPMTFTGDTSTLPQTQNPSIEAGAYTNAEDYGKILLMHLRGGTCDGTRILSEGSVKAMQKDRVASYGGSTEQQMRTILTGADEAALAGALDFSGYGMGWWVDRTHPGVFNDPGAFGSASWIDVPRGYGGFIAIEGNVVMGADLIPTKAAVDAVFDAAKP
jgi:CubicO group peptidase (beta-lactamase class C family)